MIPMPFEDMQLIFLREQLSEQHDDHIWLTVGGSAWAIRKIEGNTFHLWRGYEPNLEYATVRLERFDVAAYTEMAAAWLDLGDEAMTKLRCAKCGNTDPEKFETIVSTTGYLHHDRVGDSHGGAVLHGYRCMVCGEENRS